MKNNYWTQKHQDQVCEYYKAQFSPNCDQIRNRLFTTVLYPALVIMQETAIKSFGHTPTDDNIQDIMIHLFSKTLPKLNEEKLQGQLNFLWTSTRNYVITYILNPKKEISLEDVIVQEKLSEENQLEVEYTREENRILILRELDKMIAGQRILNSTNVVFLILFKQYIIDNDYDVRGFGDYICKKMNLTTQQYRSVAARLGIKTKILNEKLLGS